MRNLLIKKIATTRIIFLIQMILVSSFALASDISYNQSQSSYTDSKRLRLGYKINPENKLNLSYSQSKSRVTMDDPDSSTLRLGYRYGGYNQTQWTIEFKLSDESYFFTGKGLSIKSNLPLFENGRLLVSLGGHQKTYSKANSESLLQGDLQVGVDIDVGESFNFGFDNSLSRYATASGGELASALADQTVNTSDLNSYASVLLKDSFLIYAEFSIYDLVLGASAGIDHSHTANTRNSNSSIYLDYGWQDWSVSFSYGRSLSELSSTSTVTTSLGLGYGF